MPLIWGKGTRIPQFSRSLQSLFDEFGEILILQCAYLPPKRSWGYNLANRMVSETYFSTSPLAGLAVTNEYDEYQRRTALAALKSGTAFLNGSFSYDTASRLLTVADNAGNVVTWSAIPTLPIHRS